MASDRIKGITIEIDGDSKGLSQALKGVNKDIKSTQTQLKDVEKLLKLDPHNVTLLGQKMKIAVSNTEKAKAATSPLEDLKNKINNFNNN